jgi:MFS family permease
VVISLFWLAPLTPMERLPLSAVMGLLWLSTVPPTNAVVAQIFGVQYMSMLGGFVFLSHQVGSFLGAWLGGKLYDLTGSYDVVWWIAVALGVFAALANLPVRETPIPRAMPAAQPCMNRACAWQPGPALPRWRWCSLPTSARTWWSTWPTGCGPASDALMHGSGAPSPWCNAGRTCCRPAAAACSTWPAAAAATCAGWPRRAAP